MRHSRLAASFLYSPGFSGLELAASNVFARGLRGEDADESLLLIADLPEDLSQKLTTFIPLYPRHPRAKKNSYHAAHNQNAAPTPNHLDPDSPLLLSGWLPAANGLCASAVDDTQQSAGGDGVCR